MDIVVHKFNSVHAYVECDRSIAAELSEFFSFRMPDAHFHPLVKAKKWDGIVRLFNVNTHLVYLGLVPYIEEFATRRKYSIKIDPAVMQKTGVGVEDVVAFAKQLNIHSGGTPITPFDYQLFAVWQALKYKRKVFLASTSAGKSLIIYIIARWLIEHLPDDKKLLIVVPDTGLLCQMVSDFADYASHVSWNVEDAVHTISSGANKQTDKKIVVSTWQSIYRCPERYFQQFAGVIVDEVHRATATCIRSIAEKLTECDYRIGLTGTLRDSKTAQIVLEGIFGPVKRIVGTTELIERKIVAGLKIRALAFIYSDDDKKLFKPARNKPAPTYKDELNWIFNHPTRMKMLTNYISMLNNNALVLFSKRAHGKSIVESLKQITSRPVLYVDGMVDGTTRNEIRHGIENANDAIIVASYGVFSTGMSVKNIHHVVFAAPSKSKIRVLQSIGRGLRRKSGVKESVVIHDIIDDLSSGSYKNYAVKHFIERAEIYSREGFDFTTTSIKM